MNLFVTKRSSSFVFFGIFFIFICFFCEAVPVCYTKYEILKIGNYRYLPIFTSALDQVIEKIKLKINLPRYGT